MTLDSLLAHIPAWREFFVEPWSAITMTPEKHTQATQLEQRHRQLSLELKQWQMQAEPTTILPGNMSAALATTPVPIALWLALKNGMVANLQALIAANRKAFDEL